MKIRDGFMTKRITEDYLVVPVGSNAVNFNEMMSLNGTGFFLWQAMEQETTVDELVEKLQEEYDVEEDVARADIADFIMMLKNKDLILE